MPTQPLPRDLPSGLGPRILVSPGAEEFDPDSMVDEPEILPSNPEEANKRALALAPKPFLALTLAPPLGEELQVAGFLHKMSSTKHHLGLVFECLLPFGLKLSELALANERTAYVS